MRRTRPLKEFQLLAACCRWPLDARAIAAIVSASAGADWPLFLKLARRHRVEALVEHALRQAGVEPSAEVAGPLREASSATVRQNVALAAESVRLKQLFDRAGIPLLFVKGATLGMLAYGTLSVKMGWDIDVLIPPDRLEAAADLLQDAGYVWSTKPEAGREALLAWHAVSKETTWVNEARQSHVELHTRLVDNERLLPDIGPKSPTQEVAVSSGSSLPTLAKDELFAYLCVHGASSAWFRIKWIADVGALLGDPVETERLYRRSQELGAGRAAAQALLLCAHLFETELPPALARELRSDWGNRYLFASALRLMSGPMAATELHERTLGTLPIHLTQFFLRQGLRFKRSELRRQIASPDAASITGRLMRKLRGAPPA